MGIGLVLGALVLPYFILLQSPDIANKQSWCPVKLITGMPCPGCGMLKSWCYLSHLDIQTSLYYHPLGLVAFAAGIFAFFWLIAEYYFNKPIPLPWQGHPWVTYIVVIVFAGVHIWRLNQIVSSPGILLTYWHQGYFYKTVKFIGDLIYPTS